MARGDVRIAVTLACEECKRRNYQTEKSKRNDPERIELRKHCRWCGRHTTHKETRLGAAPDPDSGSALLAIANAPSSVQRTGGRRRLPARPAARAPRRPGR